MIPSIFLWILPSSSLSLHNIQQTYLNAALSILPSFLKMSLINFESHAWLPNLPLDVVLLIADRLNKQDQFLLAGSCNNICEMLARFYLRPDQSGIEFASWVVENSSAARLKTWLNNTPRIPSETLEKWRQTLRPKSGTLEKWRQTPRPKSGYYAKKIKDDEDIQGKIAASTIDAALLLAAKRHKEAMVRTIMEHGKHLLMDVDSGLGAEVSESTFEMLLRDGADPQSCAEPLIGSVKRGEVEFTEMLLGCGMKMGMTSSATPDTAVYWAARQSDTTILKVLAERKAQLKAACSSKDNFLGVPPEEQCTPLYAAACVAPTTSCLEFLLENEYLIPSTEGAIPQYLLGHLVRGGYFPAGPIFGIRKPFLTEEKGLESMKLLLKFGLSPDAKCSMNGELHVSLLGYATWRKKNKFVELLLEKGASLEIEGYISPLSVALEENNIQATELLLTAHHKKNLDLPYDVLWYDSVYSSMKKISKRLLDAIKRESSLDLPESTGVRASKRREYTHRVNGAGVNQGNDFEDTAIKIAAIYSSCSNVHGNGSLPKQDKAATPLLLKRCLSRIRRLPAQELPPATYNHAFRPHTNARRSEVAQADQLRSSPSPPAMLSAFTARPIIELRPRDKSKIETILAHVEANQRVLLGDRILVGLNSGALRIYRLNEPIPVIENGHAGNNSISSSLPPNSSDHQPRPSSRGSARPTDLLREVEKFSTRAIEQLAIIKEANTIVSLSNYHVSLHDLQTYELIETLDKTKNASGFAVTSNIVKDPDTGIPEIISRLAVSVKRRLLLWSWHECELGGDTAEVVLAESIRSVTWASATKVVCGMNGGYVMVDALTHEIEDITGPGTVGAAGQSSRFGAVSSAGMGYMGLGGYMPKPLASKLADGEVLLAKDINTLFIDDTGKPLNQRQIPWGTAPESIGYSYPYIVALQPPAKGSLEVRNPDTLSLLQTISLPGAAQLYFPPPNVSLAHAGKGFHISSERCVWKMGATDYDAQVKELVDAGNYDEAISVLNLLEDALLKSKMETLREVKMQKAEILFGEKKYRKAMDLFNEDNVHAPPERVLALYPPVISGELSKWAGKEEPKSSDADGATPRVSAETQRKSEDAGESTSAVGRFAGYFMGSQRRTAADAASIISVKREASDATDDKDSADSAASADKPLEGKDLMKAVLELNGYLAGTRARLQRVIDPATGLLKPRDSTPGEDATDRFLRMGQNESESQLQEKLQGTFRLVDTTLFRAYMLSQPSLASSLFRIPNFCDPDVVHEKLVEQDRYNELIDFFHGKKLHKQALALLVRFGAAAKPDARAPALLHGPNRTIQYLQTMPSSETDLILEHAAWTLRASPAFAMEIFTGDTENAETLPRARVAAFLQTIEPALERQYLEHVVMELEDATPDLHNRLVELYISALENMQHGDAEWEPLMGRFIKFLQAPNPVYSLGKAFSTIPRNDPFFYEAQAVVLSNMGQHKQALEIFVFKMQNYAKAEEYIGVISNGTAFIAGLTPSRYCNRIQRQAPTPAPHDASDDEDGDDAPSIYHTLLSLYLQPPSPHKSQLAPALDLLSKHGARLPAASSLSLIPDDLPVRALESYFGGRIRAANSMVHEAQVVAALRKAEGIAVAAELHVGTAGKLAGRNRHVAITDEKLCVVCHRRLGGGMRVGGGSVVAVLPDNTVVHWGCLSSMGGDQRPKTPSWARH
ncbi:AvaB protein [Cordyceps militaris]|uniref:AvaB protein n=1 Tax=Cordyceps militaris TaxID=73501 RepID=A0A2H4SI87_CORMI|nr:AvaB protein [Cordyceps militaris]